MARVVAALLVLGLAAPAGAAAATWSEPQEIVDSIPSSSCCGDLGFASDGAGAAFFTGQSFGEDPDWGLQVTHLPTRSTTGEWTDHATAAGRPRAFRALRLRAFRDGRLIVVGSRVRFEPYKEIVTGLAARFGQLTPDGVVVDSHQALVPDASFEYFDFAANRGGDAVVAWVVDHGRDSGIWMRRAVRGGRFGKRERVAVRPGRGYVLAAVGRHGHVAIAWGRGERHPRIYARVARRGRALGVRHDLVPPGGGMRLAAGPRGEVLFTKIGAAGELSVPLLEATLSEPMGRHPRPHPLDFDEQLYRGRRGPIAAFDGAGRPLVAWSSDAPRAATYEDGRWEVQELEPDGVVDELAVGPGDRAAVAIRRESPPSDSGVFVALRGPSGSFGPGEQAAPDDALADGESLAFDPLTGEPYLLYLSRDHYHDTSGGDVYAVARQPG
jgi:hypothetical protein